MRPVRSILYIPANREDGLLEAPEKYDGDAFLFDLEDTVPASDKAAVREIVADAYEQWDTDKVVTVRLNAPGTGLFEADLDADVHERLDAFVVPKLPRTE